MIAIVATPAATPIATLRPLPASASEWNEVMPNPKAESATAAMGNSLMSDVSWFKALALKWAAAPPAKSNQRSN